jgi:hypothetical protein
LPPVEKRGEKGKEERVRLKGEEEGEGRRKGKGNKRS